MGEESDNRPFSQRHGLEPIPQQLKIGEVSAEFRLLLWHAVYPEFSHCMSGSYGRGYIEGYWEDILRDMCVRMFKQMPDEFDIYGDHTSTLKAVFQKTRLSQLFDVVEFILRHRSTPNSLRVSIASAFVDARAAYRVMDQRTIVPIASQEEAQAFGDALAALSKAQADGARVHLVAAGQALREGRWADSVRESIHAVEAAATKVAPGTGKLAEALAALEKDRKIHGGLKKAFGSLYGYSSDEQGVRHALVFETTAQVDERDAMFMLGACAAFISYLATGFAQASDSRG